MSWIRFFRRARWDAERARELEAHLEIETGENVARGMPPGEARYAARRKLGNTLLVREEIYHMNSIGFLETLGQDLRYGVRLLRLNPGFTLVAVASLALGIGANTAIFQLLDAVRLRTLPVKNPQELAEIKIADRSWAQGNFSSRHPQLTNPLWERIRDRQQGFSGMLAWSEAAFNLSTGGEVRYAQALFVSGDFFRVLGVQALRGRLLTVADDRRGCGSPGVVISHSFWQREFGGDASALGRKLTLEGHPFEIIGITPAGFFGLEPGRTFDVALPICAEPAIRVENSRLDWPDGWWLAVIGRLKPGWSVPQATAQLKAISSGLFEATVPPRFNAESAKKYRVYQLGAFPAGTGLSEFRDDYDKPLWLLLAIAGLVLLIACANLANLMLARASAREREIVIRLAIGASRGRLIRQMLAESLLLSALGAACGSLLAGMLSRSLVSFLSTRGNAVFFDLTPDWRVFGFTAGLAVLTCVVFGLAPAVRATNTSPAAALKSSGRGLTANRERFGLRRILVISQVALSLVLLVGAFLFTPSLRNLLTVETGFRQDGILVAQLGFDRLNLPKENRLAFKRELIERIRAIPGVDSAADTSSVPISGMTWNGDVFIDGPERDLKRLSWFLRVTPEYFKTMGTPLLGGRAFDGHDVPTAPKVAIVNQTFARKFLNGANPIGKRFRVEAAPGEPEPLYEIVGLVKDTKYGHLREEQLPIAFFPSFQDEHPDQSAQLVIHSGTPMAGLTAAVKHVVGEINPNISIDFSVFKTQILDSLLRERLVATLSGFFGFLAALLATIGLYGVMSYTVAQRRNEIGIRMALGAGWTELVNMLLREAGWLLIFGLAAGLALALAAVRAAESMLFGLQPYDPAAIISAMVLLAAVALAASFIPARRAANLQPMAALREE